MTSYQAPWIHRHAHLSTILPNKFRPVKRMDWEVRRFTTPDQDFFDVGTSLVSSERAVVLLHGLGGSMHSLYMHGMAAAVQRENFDVWALNHRGCSGALNQRLYSYHSGFTNDLNQLIVHLSEQYKSITVIGFSLGGNIALKWAGSEAHHVDHRVKGMVAISVPCDLANSAVELSKAKNRIYLWRFLRPLKQKALAKLKLHPEHGLDESAIRLARDFHAFDDAYTAPVNGFESALHYYESCSSKRFMNAIQIPTHVINAANDSFLGPGCFPEKEASENPALELIIPSHGGHVGFARTNFMRGEFWHESLAREIILKQLDRPVPKKT